MCISLAKYFVFGMCFPAWPVLQLCGLRSRFPGTCPTHDKLEPAAGFMVCFAVTTYKRTWQLQSSLPVNLVFTMKHRLTVHWVIVDLNDVHLDDHSDAIEALLQGPCGVASRAGHVSLFRRRDPGSDTFDGWHASIAKNSAAAAASYVSQDAPCILVNVDNDNFVTDEFVRKVVEHGRELLGIGPRKLHGLFFRHPKVGATTGRIACSLEDFYRVGGYLEDMGPSGYQDVFLMKCLSLLGRTQRVWSPEVGVALTNSPEVQSKKQFWKVGSLHITYQCISW